MNNNIFVFQLRFLNIYNTNVDIDIKHNQFLQRKIIQMNHLKRFLNIKEDQDNLLVDILAIQKKNLKIEKKITS